MKTYLTVSIAFIISGNLFSQINEKDVVKTLGYRSQIEQKNANFQNYLILETKTLDSAKARFKKIAKKIDLSKLNFTKKEASGSSENARTATTAQSATSGSPSTASSSFGQLLVMPSPNASSISVAGQGNVDMYTGKFNFNLPIYTLKSRTLEVPISLSYSTSGAKVDENSSWVGHQWSLSAGGVISRVMKGLPDEFDGRIGPTCSGCPDFAAKGYLNTKSTVNWSSLENSTDYAAKQRFIELADFSSLTGKNDGRGFPIGLDSQPDEFYFNFGNYSGKFVFDQDGNILTIPYQNLTITKTIVNNTSTGNRPKIAKFEVVTPEGTTYVFGDSNFTSVEESKLETISMTNFYQYVFLDVNSNGVSFYHRIPALGITNVLGNPSQFDVFVNPGNSNLTMYNFFTSAFYLKEIKTFNGDDIITLDYTDAGELTYFQNKSITATMPNLSEIIFPGETPWMFVSPTPPIQSPRGLVFPGKQAFTYSLNEIIVKSKRLDRITTDTNNSAAFIASTNRNDLYLDKRLDEIVLFGNGIKTKSFKLEYEEILSPSTFDLFALGEFIEMNADEGFKGQKFTILSSKGISLNQTEFFSKYQNIFAAESRRLFLKSVTETSPSGGKMNPYSFEYDPQILPRKFSYKKDKWGYHNSNSKGMTIPTFSYISTRNEIMPISGNMLIGWDVRDPTTTNGVFGADQGANLTPNLGLSQAGILKKIVYPTGGSKQVLYELNTGFHGLRVSEEKDFSIDGDMSNAIVKKYNYTGPAEVNTSIQYSYYMPLNDVEDMVISSSSPVNPTYQTKGSVVGYRSSQASILGTGKTVFTFKNPSTEPNEPSTAYAVFANGQDALNSNSYPFPQQLDADWRRGLIEKTESFNESGILVDRTTYNYDTKPSNFTNSFSYGMVGGGFSLGGFFAGLTIPVAGFYKYQSGWVNPISTTNEIIDQVDPTKKITLTTETSYIKPNQSSISMDLLPRKITKILPDGDKVVTENKFASDYGVIDYQYSNDPAAKGIYKLQQSKVSNALIESFTYLEKYNTNPSLKYLLGGSLNLYKEFPGPSSSLLVYLNQVKKLKPGVNSLTNVPWSFIDLGYVPISGGVWKLINLNYASHLYKSTKTYEGYNFKGNPTSSNSELGIPIDYIWGYNNALLIETTVNPGVYQHKTNYTHTPLVGIAQISDPNQQANNFTYDNFNRLKLIKDTDTNILSRFRYNLKNEKSNGIDFRYLTNSNPSTDHIIQFTALGSGEPGTTLTWDFGNGIVKENGAVSEFQTYATPGVYSVKLLSAHPEYPSVITTKSIVILPPVTIVLTSGSTTVCLQSGSLTLPFAATVSGGSYSYSWEYQANGSSWTATGTNSTILNFSYQSVHAPLTTFRCRIFDLNGNSRYSNTISIHHNCNTGGGGGGDDGGGGGGGGCPEGCFWNGSECVCP
jgi:hypothetical protein